MNRGDRRVSDALPTVNTADLPQGEVPVEAFADELLLSLSEADGAFAFAGGSGPAVGAGSGEQATAAR